MTWETLNYESGLDRGVFYPSSGPGEPWNGLISIVEDYSSDVKTGYIDGVKNHQRRPLGYFEGIIEAYSYPASFFDNILTQKRSKTFGMSYRVTNAKGYQIHLVYNVLLSPSSYLYQQQEVESLNWNFTSFPIPIPTVARSAHVVIDVPDAYSWTVTAIEDILYGTDAAAARLPLPEEVFEVFEENSILRIIDHGDGTWTAIGPDEVIQMLDATTFEITWPSAIYIDAVSYTISSL